MTTWSERIGYIMTNREEALKAKRTLTQLSGQELRRTINNKLKSCPFCGSDYAPDYYEDEFTNWKIICKLRKGGCGASTAICATFNDAVEAWNRRPDEKDMV